MRITPSRRTEWALAVAASLTAGFSIGTLLSDPNLTAIEGLSVTGFLLISVYVAVDAARKALF